jgi:hypothetical protein
LLPLLLLPQLLGDAAQRLLEFLLFRDLDHNSADLRNLAQRILDRNEMLNPMPGLGTGGQYGTDFDIQNRLLGS